MENTKYYFSVTYRFDNGEPGTAYVWYESPESIRPDENTPNYFRKNFSGDSEKEVRKAAEAYAKAHNKIIREKRAQAKAALIAKKEAKKAEKTAQKEKAMAEIKASITPEIREIVKILFENQRKSIIESLNAQYENFVQKLKKLEGFSYYSPEVKAQIRDLRGSAFSKAYDRLMEVPGKEGGWSPNDLKYLKKDYQKIVEKMVLHDTETIMGLFLHKMERKLAGIIKDKKIKVFNSKGLYTGSVYFEFEDGSRFYMINSIEYGQSMYGVNFQRFPCRFHDVTFSNGSKMKNPSELKMKRDF